jgi:hypothetical protein
LLDRLELEAMADRSDDIKQLFSHLGLNPGDYQEMREKTRALSRGTEDARVQAAANTRHAAEAATSKAQQAPAFPPTVRLNPLITRMPAAGSEAAQRWPLLKAAVETPTRVAQRSEPPVAQTPAASTPDSARSPGSANEVTTLLQAVEQAKALERAESDAIERTTRRVVEELQRHRVPPQETERESAQATPQAAAAQLRSTSPTQGSTATATAEAPKTSFFQKPGARPRTEATVAAPASAAPASESAAASAASGSELQSAFQRLSDPERIPPQRFSRLKFNYRAAEAPSKPKKLKEENLEDVFSRISGPPKSR